MNPAFKLAPFTNEVHRFTSKVDDQTASGCIPWGRGKDEKGYGRFKLHGRASSAHRAAYILFRGPIPEGMEVCHSCDNPSCVNPEHLWLGTRQANIDDKMAKGRHRGPHQGEAHHKAKLTETKVRQMRVFRHDLGFSYDLLAKMFSVHKMTCRMICIGSTWRHILPRTA